MLNSGAVVVLYGVPVTVVNINGVTFSLVAFNVSFELYDAFVCDSRKCTYCFVSVINTTSRPMVLLLRVEIPLSH